MPMKNPCSNGGFCDHLVSEEAMIAAYDEFEAVEEYYSKLPPADRGFRVHPVPAPY